MQWLSGAKCHCLHTRAILAGVIVTLAWWSGLHEWSLPTSFSSWIILESRNYFLGIQRLRLLRTAIATFSQKAMLFSTNGLSSAKTCTTLSWRQIPTSFKATRLETLNLQTYQSYEKGLKQLYTVWREKVHKALIMCPLSCSSRGGGWRNYKSLHCPVPKESGNAWNGPKKRCSHKSYPSHNKGNSKQCRYYRTITLISATEAKSC